MHPVKLLERAASTAAHTVRHPISTASYAVGVARGLAGAAIQVARPHREEAGRSTPSRTIPEQTEPQEAAGSRATGVPEPERVGKPMPPPYATDEMLEQMVVIEPEPPHESFATEPKAVSRESAHGGSDTVDAEIDAWTDEAENLGADLDVESPVGAEPVLDPGTVKSVLKESEILRKAADPDKG